MALQPYPASLQVSLFTYFVLHQCFCLLFGWVFVAVHGLFCSCSKWRLLFAVVCGLLAVHLLLWSVDSRACGLQELPHVARRLQSVGLVVPRRLSCSACGSFPDQGSDPVSPELVSEFLSTGLPGKPVFVHLECMVVSIASRHFPSLGDQNEVLFIILCYQTYFTHCLHIGTQISETMMLLILFLGTFSCDLLDLHYSKDSFRGYQRQVQRRQWQPTPVLLLGKSQSRGACWAAVHGVAKSRTRLSDFTFIFHLHALEKNPLQYSCLENPRDGGAWWAAIYGVAQSQTRLKRLSSSSSQRQVIQQKRIVDSIVNVAFDNTASKSSS